MICIPRYIYLCQKHTILPYHYVTLILDNISILLLKNILADPLEQEIGTMLNLLHFCKSIQAQGVIPIENCPVPR